MVATCSGTVISRTAGAKHVADILAGTGSLTNCNVLRNSMDVAAAWLLVKAVEGKDISLAALNATRRVLTLRAKGSSHQMRCCWRQTSQRLASAAR